jgi:hypothetical protein
VYSPVAVRTSPAAQAAVAAPSWWALKIHAKTTPARRSRPEPGGHDEGDEADRDDDPRVVDAAVHGAEPTR